MSPLRKLSSLVPFSTSTYLRPSAERGRIRSVESRGRSPCSFSSSSVSSAPVEPSSSRTGRMSVTTPMREPPERTSLPLTRLAPLATRTLTVVVGTNGRPLLAL